MASLVRMRTKPDKMKPWMHSTPRRQGGGLGQWTVEDNLNIQGERISHTTQIASGGEAMESEGIEPGGDQSPESDFEMPDNQREEQTNWSQSVGDKQTHGNPDLNASAGKTFVDFLRSSLNGAGLTGHETVPKKELFPCSELSFKDVLHFHRRATWIMFRNDFFDALISCNIEDDDLKWRTLEVRGGQELRNAAKALNLKARIGTFQAKIKRLDEHFYAQGDPSRERAVFRGISQKPKQSVADFINELTAQIKFTEWNLEEESEMMGVALMERSLYSAELSSFRFHLNATTGRPGNIVEANTLKSVLLGYEEIAKKNKKPTPESSKRGMKRTYALSNQSSDEDDMIEVVERKRFADKDRREDRRDSDMDRRWAGRGQPQTYRTDRRSAARPSGGRDRFREVNNERYKCDACGSIRHATALCPFTLGKSHCYSCGGGHPQRLCNAGNRIKKEDNKAQPEHAMASASDEVKE